MEACYSEELVEKLTNMTKEIIKPEPEYSMILSYLAKYCHHKGDWEKEIVYLANSFGVQLRSDVEYWREKREDLSEEEEGKRGPVLDGSHLKLFENFEDLMTRLRDLPEEWTVIQVTKQYSPLDILEAVKNQTDTGIFLTRFTCGKLAERILPYSFTIKSRSSKDESFLQLFRDLFKTRSDYFSSGGFSRKIMEDYANTDCALAKLLSELENHWLKEWRCILGGRLEDKNLEHETYQNVKIILDNFKKKNKKIKSYSAESLDIVYQLTLGIHLLKNHEALNILNHALNNKDNEDLMPLVIDLRHINLGNSSAVRNAKKLPVILIVDKAFEIIPWEMMSLLIGQPVTRILSLHLLYGLYKYHEAHIDRGYRILKINSGYCLINPSKDLNECEKAIVDFLKRNMPWIETEAGKVPDPKLLVSRFWNYDTFLYCGHGSGRQYLKVRHLKNAFVKGLVLLFGCSSNLPKTSGGRTPFNNDTYTYITNGSPCQIGCIYDITSSDADIACKKMLHYFLPTTKESNPNKLEAPREPDVLRGLIAGKSACKKYWSQCAFVARGIPCKTEAGDISN